MAGKPTGRHCRLPEANVSVLVPFAWTHAATGSLRVRQWLPSTLSLAAIDGLARPFPPQSAVSLSLSLSRDCLCIGTPFVTTTIWRIVIIVSLAKSDSLALISVVPVRLHLLSPEWGTPQILSFRCSPTTVVSLVCQTVWPVFHFLYFSTEHLLSLDHLTTLII